MTIPQDTGQGMDAEPNESGSSVSAPEFLPPGQWIPEAAEKTLTILGPAFQSEPKNPAPPTPIARGVIAQPLPTVVDRYHIGTEIARGGVGIIYAGRDMELGREVAFKVLQETHQQKAPIRERFLEEARIAAQLQHPGIVPIYEIGKLPDGRPYFTMKLVEGRTLEELLTKRTEVSQDLPRFLKIFDRVCQTIAYSHTRGVIHRDLKPGNIMVGAFGEVQIMDWGLAKILPGRVEKAVTPMLSPAEKEEGTEEPKPPIAECPEGSVLGTLAYMPPEQARGEIEHLDERVDVFGLGALLCTILTGQPPYPGHNNIKLYRQAVRGDLGNAYHRLDRCGADGRLLTLAKHCLAPERSDRPKNAGEVEQVLTEYLDFTLRQSERDLVRFFELSPDLFCIAGLDGFFRRVNSNFSRVLGYSEKELVSRPFLDFVHEEDRACTIAEVEKLNRGLPVVRFRNRYCDVHGDYHWFEWTAKSIPEERVIFAVARDVTDRPCPE